MDGVVAGWAARRAAQGRDISSPPVSIEARLWFNEANDSSYFLVPGLMVLVMTLIGGLLTAMVMAREWERGTLESLLVTPVRSDEILLGKTLPYFALALVGFTLCVLSAQFLFHVPLRGSFLILFGASMLYVLIALGIGLLISAWVKNQLVASQLTMLVTFLPAFMLSGFLFDIRSMPTAVRVITYVLPARYYVALLQSVFLAGNVWSVIVPSTLVLARWRRLWRSAAAPSCTRGWHDERCTRRAYANRCVDAQGAARGAQGSAQPHESADSADRSVADLRLCRLLRSQPCALCRAGRGSQRGLHRALGPARRLGRIRARRRRDPRARHRDLDRCAQGAARGAYRTAVRASAHDGRHGSRCR